MRLLLALLLVLPAATSCGYLKPYRTPAHIQRWRPTDPPQLSLREKARAYQERLERDHQMPDGVIRYRWWPEREATTPGYGNLADGSFFLGIYLASQALRYSVTRDPAAWHQLELTLDAMELHLEASGKRGLLARYVSPAPAPGDNRWRPSATHPEYFWRSDVSKDQYAGYVHGLGVTLAVISDPGVRTRVAELAGAIADHLDQNDLLLIDWDDERTTHGNLRGRIFGIPIGVNALISLAIAKTAAEAPAKARHQAFYERLVEQGYPAISYWSHFSMFGITNVDNDNMGYLSLYPLLLLERDPEIAAELRRGGRRSWAHVKDARNTFFAFVHAAVVERAAEDRDAGQAVARSARWAGKQALREFPDEKTAWPVDLTREGFDFPRAFLKTSDGLPRAESAVPVYLRPMSSSMWTSDPRQLVGALRYRGDLHFAGIDYLIAYWMGRYHGFISPDE